MRAYALKREAYHSALVTEEESRAHLDALRRLAGLPALTQPWTDHGIAVGSGSSHDRLSQPSAGTTDRRS